MTCSDDFIWDYFGSRTTVSVSENGRADDALRH
jgi:hypothetical protein